MCLNKEKMEKSPIFPKHETEFDPQLDFAQFLKEAKVDECEVKLDAATIPHSSKVAANKQLNEGRKNKKSWKKSLFSWLKADKMCKLVHISEEQPSNKLHNISKPRRAYLSGLIKGDGTSKSEQRPNSGPLAGFFNSTKRMEKKVPYVRLGRLNNPRGVLSYGPIYMVS